MARITRKSTKDTDADQESRIEALESRIDLGSATVSALTDETADTLITVTIDGTDYQLHATEVVVEE